MENYLGKQSGTGSPPVLSNLYLVDTTLRHINVFRDGFGDPFNPLSKGSIYTDLFETAHSYRSIIRVHIENYMREAGLGIKVSIALKIIFKCKYGLVAYVSYANKNAEPSPRLS